jgi:transposase
MNEKNPQEIQFRRLAFKFFAAKKSVAYILQRIPRSRAWLFKWKERFQREGWQALDSRSKAPAHSPQEHAEETVELVLRLRARLEQRAVGLSGPREIQQEIRRQRLLKAPPSLASIKRWLKQAGVSGVAPAASAAVYYPTLQRADDLTIFACDWIARYLTGGKKVFAFHTLNLCTPPTGANDSHR